MSSAIETACPYCGAYPDEPCRNQRTVGQTSYGAGSTAVGYPDRGRPTKRPHPERVAEARGRNK